MQSESQRASAQHTLDLAGEVGAVVDDPEVRVAEMAPDHSSDCSALRHTKQKFRQKLKKM